MAVDTVPDEMDGRDGTLVIVWTDGGAVAFAVALLGRRIRRHSTTITTRLNAVSRPRLMRHIE